MNICMTHEGYIELFIEDHRGHAMILSIYNQPGTILDKPYSNYQPHFNQRVLKRMFQPHYDIGIKQPYLTMNGAGQLTLLNTAYENLIFSRFSYLHLFSISLERYIEL